jgi:hypothetical protein
MQESKTRMTSDLLTWKIYYSNPTRKRDLARPRKIKVVVQLVSELDFRSVFAMVEEEDDNEKPLATKLFTL